VRVLIAGSIARDTNFLDDDVRSDWGGTVVYAARAYRALDIEVRVLTSAAEPIDAAFPASVEVVALPSPVTTRFENHYHSDGKRTQRAPTLAAPLPFDAALVSGVDWVHLGPLHPHDLVDDWYSISGNRCGLDVQGLTRHVVNGEVIADPRPDAATIAARMCWLKASIREWTLLHAPAVPGEVLITRGIEGGVLECDAGSSTWRADPPVDDCDPTGAGDVFFAAYLSRRNGGATAADAARDAAKFTSAFLRRRRGQDRRPDL